MSDRMWRRGPDGEIVRASPPSPDDPPGVAAPPRASIRMALRLGFRDGYDYLGSVVVMSFLWALAASSAMIGAQTLGARLFERLPGVLPVVLSTLAAFTALFLVGGPLGAGVFRFARKAAAREEPDLFDLAWGFRHALGRSLRLAALQVYGLLLLLANCWFYLSHASLPLVVLGAIQCYLGLAWMATMLYQWPLLIEQEIPVRQVVRKSALLALDNAGYTLLLLMLVAVLTAALWASVVGAVLLWAALLAMLCTQATRELLRKYDVLPPDPTLDPMAAETEG